jgi:DegV family protein with EDD domain
MTIRIVTDSTCDLPEEIAGNHGIKVVPMYINFGEHGYQDGVDISRQEFYERLPQSDTFPTTGTPGVETFQRVYEQLAEDGATEILSIHISISLSAVVDVARTAAKQTTSVLVTVFDSKQLSLGNGFQVLTAAKAAQSGIPMNEILNLLEDQSDRTYVFAALNTLEYLKRSGRMNSVVAGIGSLLQIKPLLKMHAGKPTAERVRTKERAKRRLIELVKDLGPLEELALVHTNSPKAAEELHQEAKYLFPKKETPLSVNVTPVFGAHLGPGAVGFTSITAKEY